MSHATRLPGGQALMLNNTEPALEPVGLLPRNFNGRGDSSHKRDGKRETRIGPRLGTGSDHQRAVGVPNFNNT